MGRVQNKSGKLQDADIFVFVSYIPDPEGARLDFKREFLIIPRLELQDICKKKKQSKGKFSFDFVQQQDGRWLDIRERRDPIDVTRFHNAWHLI